jgi:CHAD domain-containing protein
MRKAGARVASHRSKFGRIMQVDVAVRDHPTTRKHASEHQLLGRHVAAVRAGLHRLDPLARADVPDAVHQTRVACRTLRATLATFETSFDTTRTEPVREELQWLGDVLGRPRDLEVLRARLGALVLAEPPSAVRGRPGPWIDARLRTAHRAAHREALDAMASDRYFALLDTLDSWRADPPWADLRDRPATKRLPKALDREWRRVRRTAAAAAAASGAERPVLLHDVRKAAKRARYAAEALVPVLGAPARAVAATAKEVQTVLGDHHDTIVAAEHVRDLAAAAEAAGRSSFTLGVLQARLEGELVTLEAEFQRVWTRAESGGRG